METTTQWDRASIERGEALLILLRLLSLGQTKLFIHHQSGSLQQLADQYHRETKRVDSNHPIRFEEKTLCFSRRVMESARITPGLELAGLGEIVHQESVRFHDFWYKM